MNGRRNLARITAAAALLAVLLVAGATGAHAQLAWPCAKLKVVNTTGCATTLNIQTLGGGIISIPVPAAAPFPNPPIPAGTSFTGIWSQAGIFYALVAPVPPATAWCVFNVYLPGSTCCFDVCFDPTTCTVTLSPSAGPPPCNP